MDTLKKKLRQAETDRDAMKTQSENLQEEYTRVCTLLNKKDVSDRRREMILVFRELAATRRTTDCTARRQKHVFGMFNFSYLAAN